jgi:hypothetical protein
MGCGCYAAAALSRAVISVSATHWFMLVPVGATMGLWDVLGLADDLRGEDRSGSSHGCPSYPFEESSARPR